MKVNKKVLLSLVMSSAMVCTSIPVSTFVSSGLSSSNVSSQAISKNVIKVEIVEVDAAGKVKSTLFNPQEGYENEADAYKAFDSEMERLAGKGYRFLDSRIVEIGGVKVQKYYVVSEKDYSDKLLIPIYTGRIKEIDGNGNPISFLYTSDEFDSGSSATDTLESKLEGLVKEGYEFVRLDTSTSIDQKFKNVTYTYVVSKKQESGKETPKDKEKPEKNTIFRAQIKEVDEKGNSLSMLFNSDKDYKTGSDSIEALDKELEKLKKEGYEYFDFEAIINDNIVTYRYVVKKARSLYHPAIKEVDKDGKSVGFLFADYVNSYNVEDIQSVLAAELKNLEKSGYELVGTDTVILSNGSNVLVYRVRKKDSVPNQPNKPEEKSTYTGRIKEIDKNGNSLSFLYNKEGFAKGSDAAKALDIELENLGKKGYEFIRFENSTDKDIKNVVLTYVVRKKSDNSNIDSKKNTVYRAEIKEVDENGKPLSSLFAPNKDYNKGSEVMNVLDAQLSDLQKKGYKYYGFENITNNDNTVTTYRYLVKKIKKDEIKKTKYHVAIKEVDEKGQSLSFLFADYTKDYNANSAQKALDSQLEKAKKEGYVFVKAETNALSDGSNVLVYIVKKNKTTSTKPNNKDKSESGRISGRDRTGTSVEVSKSTYEKADTVIVTRKDMFPDSMTSTVLSRLLKAPILLTDSNRLDTRVKEEIKRLGARDVIIVGGTSSVTDKVKDELKIFDKDNVERVYGNDRYSTSVAVAKRVFSIKGNKRAIVASGEVFPDALSVSSFAAREGYPIILVKKNDVPNVVNKAMSELNIKETYLIGGTGTVEKSVENKLPNVIERISGKNRYETSALISRSKFNDSYVAYLASGEVFSDALVLGPLAAKYNAPVLLTPRNYADKSVSDFIKKSKLKKLMSVGGNMYVPDSILNKYLLTK